MSGSQIFGLMLTVLIVALVFLVIRELVCWYWKINRQVDLLTDIRSMLESYMVANSIPIRQSKYVPPAYWDCKTCNRRNAMDNTVCAQCGQPK